MAASTVLTVPQEILLRIFESLCDQRDNARNARVCKAWKETALDEVWRGLEEWTRPLYYTHTCTFRMTGDQYVKVCSRVQSFFICPTVKDQLF